MKAVCLLVLLGLSMTFALPQLYRAGPGPIAVYADDDDASDEAEIDDDVDDSDMYTFPTGGPGGPPSNSFVDGARSGRDSTPAVVPSSIYYESENDIPEGVVFTYDNDEGPAAVRSGREENGSNEVETVQDEEEDEQEDEEEEEDDDAEQDDDGEPEYAVPDMNKLFPNPHNMPRGPGTYQQFMANLPKKPQGSGTQQQRPGGPQRSAPPRSPHYSSGYQGRVPPPPPTRRSRTDLAPYPPAAPYWTQSGPVAVPEDSVIVQAPTYPQRWYRMDEDESAEDEAEDEEEDEEEAADDVDFAVPSYDVLFPNAENKATPQFMGNVKNTWNNAPQPPSGVRARVLRLFHSPMHDHYNPEYVIDPTIALNRRNERLRKRYSHPAWRMQNIKHPWNYKPLLYQQGHYGNPRQYDVNPQTGDYYLGGIYNGKQYY